MSTGADCTFEEREPSVWYYHLQRHPYGDTEEYDVFGPFGSFSRAEKHLDANHGNPGGWAITRHPLSTEAQEQEVAPAVSLRRPVNPKYAAQARGIMRRRR